MMNYDAACCNNGHRDNILDSLHNQVSIGIAYSQQTDTLYFVEDFQNSYVTDLSLQTTGNVVTLQGNNTARSDRMDWQQ